MKQLLHDLLRSRVPQAGMDWLEKALEAAAPPVNANTLLGYYTGAARRLGKQGLMLSPQEEQRARQLDAELPLSHWAADEAARALLLLTLAEHMADDEFRALALKCYELGDSREQESWLRSLPLLPGNERFLATAVDACRTNIIPVFEAIACENSYPLRMFPENNFNQLVMKVIFNDLAVARILGLGERLNAELSRICDDFATEREAAGRPVPRDIWLALAPHVAPEGLPRVHRYLGHEDADHRYWAALGLAGRNNGESRAALEAQGKVERDERVKAVIDDALAGMG
jgi:hypothetical protein